jgi:UTP--glucose-1-phosphate uridylyltransferase
MKVRKVVIPAAGLGTRFLPYTKTIPKEMLPLLNKPALQWIIEEGIQANLNHFIIVTAPGKQALPNYFSDDPALMTRLKERHKERALIQLEQITKAITINYPQQTEPLGLGHAVLMAKPFINHEFFGVCLPDDIMIGQQPALGQLIAIAEQENASVIAVQEIPAESAPSYGMVGICQQHSTRMFEISHLVEKPQSQDAPSNLGIIGRYVLSPKIFQAIESIGQHGVKELQLTDALDLLIKQGEKVLAYRCNSTRYDIGTPQGWLYATIRLALEDQQFAIPVKQALREYEL